MATKFILKYSGKGATQLCTELIKGWKYAVAEKS